MVVLIRLHLWLHQDTCGHILGIRLEMLTAKGVVVCACRMVRIQLTSLMAQHGVVLVCSGMLSVVLRIHCRVFVEVVQVFRIFLIERCSIACTIVQVRWHARSRCVRVVPEVIELGGLNIVE